VTIIPPDECTAVLERAADLLDGLPHDRVGLADLHRALNETAPTYRIGEAALDLLADHLAATGGDDVWLFRWTARLGRGEAVAQLRSAAGQVLAVAA
jgi:hypothetical protein